VGGVAALEAGDFAGSGIATGSGHPGESVPRRRDDARLAGGDVELDQGDDPPE